MMMDRAFARDLDAYLTRSDERPASCERRRAGASTKLVKVDIDGPLPRDIDDRVWWTFTILRWRVAWYSYYRTRRGWHLTVRLTRAVHPWRIVAVQAILGSDYRREVFNLRRTARWRSLPAVARDRWNVLFTQKLSLPHNALHETTSCRAS